TKSVYLNTAESNNITAELIHQRLGHPAPSEMKKLVRNQSVEGINLTEEEIDKIECNPCVKAKMHRKNFNKKLIHKTTKVGEIVHSDVCGPFRTTSAGGARYFVTFIDDYSRYTIARSIQRKGQVFRVFQEIRAFYKSHGHRILKYRSDRGGEFTSNEFSE